MPLGRLSIAWRAKNRVEWLALSGLRYLTNWTNSRVRSSDLFHTKSPFSRFFGCRRQKSENIVVSARGRRTSQAPTLRISGCANARKCDYKLSSLYAQSIVLATRVLRAAQGGSVSAGRGEKSGGPCLLFLVASLRATNKRGLKCHWLAGRKMSPRRDTRHSQADDDRRHHHHQNALFSK